MAVVALLGQTASGFWSQTLHTDGNIYHTLDFNKVYQERQNFDPAGHYSRPDVTKLTINTERQSTISLVDSKDQL